MNGTIIVLSLVAIYLLGWLILYLKKYPPHFPNANKKEDDTQHEGNDSNPT